MGRLLRLHNYERWPPAFLALTGTINLAWLGLLSYGSCAQILNRLLSRRGSRAAIPALDSLNTRVRCLIVSAIHGEMSSLKF